MSDIRQAKQKNQLASVVDDDVSYLGNKSQESKPPENRRELRRHEYKHSSQENERQEIKSSVAKYPIQSASDQWIHNDLSSAKL